MPNTKTDTLQRIQQEIKECVQREEQLRKEYAEIHNNNNTSKLNGFEKPVLQRAQSTSVLTQPVTNGINSRRFTQNPTAKGVMQRFIKSRGKLNLVLNHSPSSLQTWNSNEVVIQPPKVTIEPGKRIRNGYVPVEERMKQELQEFTQRETELRRERKKSQPDLMALLEENLPVEEEVGLLKPAKSMAQLYQSADYPEETCSAPSSLKLARSLSDLCNDMEDSETPGTHYLILQFEKLRKQNEQART